MWFDQYEGKPDPSLLNEWIEMSKKRALEAEDDDESEDEDAVYR
jgi:hypothetical protein